MVFGSFDTKYLHFGVLYLSDFFWQNVLKFNFSDVLCKGHSRAEVLDEFCPSSRGRTRTLFLEM